MSEELKILEELKKDHFVDGRLPLIDKIRFELIEKELKALEIIKKYNIRPSDFHYHTTYNIYLCNMSFAEKDEIMNEEEFDLLKEELEK